MTLIWRKEGEEICGDRPNRLTHTSTMQCPWATERTPSVLSVVCEHLSGGYHYSWGLFPILAVTVIITQDLLIALSYSKREFHLIYHPDKSKHILGTGPITSACSHIWRCHRWGGGVSSKSVKANRSLEDLGQGWRFAAKTNEVGWDTGRHQPLTDMAKCFGKAGVFFRVFSPPTAHLNIISNFQSLRCLLHLSFSAESFLPFTEEGKMKKKAQIRP